VVRVIFSDSYIFFDFILLRSLIKNCISCCCDGYTFKFDDLLLQYIFNDVPQGFPLKRFGSKVIVVGIMFGDSSIFFGFIFLSSHIKHCISCCGDGYNFKFGDLLLQYIFNDVLQGFLLKRFGSKVIVVRVIFSDSYIFFGFSLLSSHIKNCISCCGDGYTFKFSAFYFNIFSMIFHKVFSSKGLVQKLLWFE
jgi:hypothetical protein